MQPLPTVFITGATKGIGLEAVRFVAARGDHDIVIAGRTPAETESVAAELRKVFAVQIRPLVLDTSSLSSVRKGAAAFKELLRSGAIGPPAALIFNAGMQSRSAPEYSADGYERTFATNCLGHFLLLNLLLDELSDAGRVVWTASGTHDAETTDGRVVGKAVLPQAELLANTGKAGKALSGGVRYATSKLCVILYSYELQRRLLKAGSKLSSIAYDPGFIPETGLGRDIPALMQWFSKTWVFKMLFRVFGGTVGDLAFSGAGLGRVAVQAEYDRVGAKYIQSKNHRLHEAKSSRVSYRVQEAAQLWDDSERLVHLHPGERPRRLTGEVRTDTKEGGM